MPRPAILEICRKDLFTNEVLLREQYAPEQVAHVIRLRDMYNWYLSNIDAKDRAFVDTACSRYKVSKSVAYADLLLLKNLLPILGAASRDFHRFRYNEMILETYQMAKARKDTKTMEKAASSYAKYNRVDLEDEQAIPYEDIVVQPFTATDDPRVLGITAIPNIRVKIQQMLTKYRRDCMDIEDVDYEEPDLEEKELFPIEEDGKEESHG